MGNQVVKLLLVGPSLSGKSTIFNKLKDIHNAYEYDPDIVKQTMRAKIVKEMLRIFHKIPKINDDYPQSKSINKWKLSFDQRNKRLIDGYIRENCNKFQIRFGDDLKQLCHDMHDKKLPNKPRTADAAKYVISYTNELLRNDHSYKDLGILYR